MANQETRQIEGKKARQELIHNMNMRIEGRENNLLDIACNYESVPLRTPEPFLHR